MRVEVCLDKVVNQWLVRILEQAHNHGPSAAPSAHPAHRIGDLNHSVYTQISTLSEAGLSPTQILTA